MAPHTNKNTKTAFAHICNNYYNDMLASPHLSNLTTPMTSEIAPKRQWFYALKH